MIVFNFTKGYECYNRILKVTTSLLEVGNVYWKSGMLIENYWGLSNFTKYEWMLLMLLKTI